MATYEQNDGTWLYICEYQTALGGSCGWAETIDTEESMGTCPRCNMPLALDYERDLEYHQEEEVIKPVPPAAPSYWTRPIEEESV